MKAETKLFPYGGAEGHPVLHLDVEGEAWDSDAAAAALAQAIPPGLFGLWLDGVVDWHAPEVIQWITTRAPESELQVIALRKLGARDFLAYGVSYVLDATEALSASPTLDALADYLADRAHAVPEIQDLVATIGSDQHTPTASMLDALAEFVQPACTSYLYAPRDHRRWQLLERAVSQCSSLWALRGSA